MKKLTLTFIYLCFFSIMVIFSGCGNNDLITKSFETNTFSGITNNISADVHITCAATQSIEISAQENIMDNIILEVSGGMLTIELLNNFSPITKPIDVYISIPQFNAYCLNGSGDMEILNTFDSCGAVSLQINGSGNIDADFSSNSVTTTTVNGSGDIDLSGYSPIQSITIDGSGNINAFPFRTLNTVVNILGSGNCEVTADSTLNVTISGSGNVYYKGTPIINTNISGSGNIINSNK